MLVYFRSLILSVLVYSAIFHSAVFEKVRLEPPVTGGLIGHYNADSWAGTRWIDLSGAGNHVTELGGTGLAVVQPIGAPKYISGEGSAWMVFPEAILPSPEYTLFFVARYNGAAKQRIFQGFGRDWFSGFGGGKAGIAYHENCIQISAPVDVHNMDWVIGSDRSNSFRSNGIDRTDRRSKNEKCASYDRLAINTGRQPLQRSDFAIQVVLVYDLKLSDAEVQQVESWLMSQQPSFSPSNLQASQRNDFFASSNQCIQMRAESCSLQPIFIFYSKVLVCRGLSASMTRVISPPAAVPVLGPLVQDLLVPSAVLQKSTAMAGS
jgi:hypothetical protein